MKSLRQKLIISTMATVVLSGGAGIMGLWAETSLSNSLRDVALTSTILHNHMVADMMHDAVRADVLAALLSHAPGSGVSLDEVNSDLAEHVAQFKSSLSENAVLATDPAMKSIISDIQAPLDRYIASAGSIVAVAASDEAKAQAALPDFKVQFSTLETAMAQAAESMEALSANVTQESEKRSEQFRIMLMATLGVIGVMSLIIFLRHQSPGHPSGCRHDTVDAAARQRRHGWRHSLR